MGGWSVFAAIEIAPGTAGAKNGEWKRLSQGLGGIARQVVASPGDTAVDRQPALACDDFATCAACGCVGPGAVMLLEFEERWQDLAHVLPVIGIVGLDHE